MILYETSEPCSWYGPLTHFTFQVFVYARFWTPITTRPVTTSYVLFVILVVSGFLARTHIPVEDGRGRILRNFSLWIYYSTIQKSTDMKNFERGISKGPQSRHFQTSNRTNQSPYNVETGDDLESW